MKISPSSEGVELITIFTVEMYGCKDKDGVYLEFKYVYYTKIEDITDL